ncbi:helix-turn-helix domain-containing protein [Nocardia vinacea]|uniref:helix-turn-helix domain-containing protein n=1 Tax=Nocardia vinacea TaxID=96468 RepID=UPI003437F5F9
MTRRGVREDPKVGELRAARCLNPHPDAVTDEVFSGSEFFDARDVVQVKYEMVRRVRVDGASVTEAAAGFGYSRQSYYEAAAALDEAGLDGLVPGKPARAAATNSPTRSANSPTPHWSRTRSCERRTWWT